ncbi:hypothetical protein C8R42DRAFT_729643 [Lentinula raphanica]|nr:hypothetical protein C8R42DRAFT_729643 [Lentinula raphanica]
MLHLWPSLDDETAKSWVEVLAVLMTRTLTKGKDIWLIECYNKPGQSPSQVEETAFLWVKPLLISADDEALVQVENDYPVISERNCQYPDHRLLGKIQENFNFDHVRIYAKSHAGFPGSSRKAEWEAQDAAWAQEYKEYVEKKQRTGRKTSGNQPKNFSDAFYYYKFIYGYLDGLRDAKAISEEQVLNWDTNVLSPFLADLIQVTEKKARRARPTSTTG